MKNLTALIEAAAAEGKGPEYSDIFSYCEQEKISPEDFSNEFALRLANGFHTGQLTYEFCDEAINYLFGFFTTPPVFGPDKNVPEPAFEIFQAFDSGEYSRPSDPPGINPIEKYTRPHIAEILSRIAAS